MAVHWWCIAIFVLPQNVFVESYAAPIWVIYALMCYWVMNSLLSELQQNKKEGKS